MTLPDVSVIIPMFNEAENVADVVPPLVAALRLGGISFELIVVDNGSRDDTAQRVRSLTAGDPAVRIVTVVENEGYGNGVLRGIEVSRGRRVAFMSGDGQIRTQDALQIVQTALRRDLPFVKAARFRRKDGLTRLVASLAYNAMLKVRFGIATWDANGTPKVLDAAILQRLHLVSKDQFLDAEVVIKMQRLGIRPVEVPVVFYPRRKGRSKVGIATVFEFLRNIWLPRARLRQSS